MPHRADNDPPPQVHGGSISLPTVCPASTFAFLRSYFGLPLMRTTSTGISLSCTIFWALLPITAL